MDFVPKNPPKFLCEICDYSTCKQKDYNKHILTRKHLYRTNLEQKIPKNPLFVCDCGKSYKARNSLWYHKKKCKYLEKSEIIEQNTIVKDETTDYKEMVLNVLNDMKEQRKEFIEELKKKDEIMMEMVGKVGTTNNNLNINMFLNDRCKNAINFSDFIDNIQISQDDLENNAQLGFVNGITKILIDNLKQLTLYERPIHCTDIKRETLYIKDSDKWEKELSDKKLEGGIQEVSRKSVGSLLKWKKENPEYENIDSEFSNKCIIMQQQSIAGDKKDLYYSKVIHNIARENSINSKQIGNI